jgi:N-acetylglucosaminyl-diphospho-decaprenol L-rhamnosyltransferase
VVVNNTPGGSAGQGMAPQGIRFLACPDNPGYGTGANRGVAALPRGGGWSGYVILNHDVEVLPGFLDAAATAVTTGAGAAAGPITLDSPDGPLWYAGGHIRYLTGTVRQERSPVGIDRERRVGFIPGTAFVVAADCWAAVGGFDEEIFLYHEDVDLCRRISRARWELRFAPAMRAVHHMGTSTGSRERSAFYLEHMSRTRLRPYRSRLYKSYLAILHTPYVLARALSLLAREPVEGREKARALMRGHRAALRDVPRR